MNAVDQNAVRRHIISQRFGIVGHRRVGNPGTGVRGTGIARRHPPNVDDAPAAGVNHMRHAGPRAANVAHHLGSNVVEDDLIGNAAGPVAGAVDRIVHQNIQPPQTGRAFPHQVDDVLRRGHIRPDGDDPRAGGVPDFGGGRLQLGHPPRADRHRAPLPRQRISGSLANALAAPGNEGRLPFQSWQHNPSSCPCGVHSAGVHSASLHSASLHSP